MTQTTPTAGGGNPLASIFDLPAIPSGEEIYDQLMSAIEPELVTAVLPTLKEKYKDETSEQAQFRAERYKKAFDEYERRYSRYCLDRDESFQARQRQAMASLERHSRTGEEQELSNLESAISSA